MSRPPVSQAAKEALARRRAEDRSAAPYFCHGQILPPPPPDPEPPEIGSRVRFLPTAFVGGEGKDKFKAMREKVTGTVVYVHPEHRWYRVEFEMGTRRPCIGHECFKF